MATLPDNLKNIFSGKSAVMLGAAALVAAGIIIYVMLNQGLDYRVLYSQLSPEDSGAVVEKLKEKKIPYKVDGTAISVPGDKVYEIRMELAGEGIPQGGGVGFEIFDKTSFGVTDFVQKINYKRALQGELARTIAQIKEVESARVTLALPERGLFLDEQKKGRASVIVKLRPSKTLSPGQVNSIVHLVASSSETLRPEDVTVVDTSGRMWTSGSSDDDGALRLSASQLDYKKSLEKDMETRVQTMLEKAVGVNKAVARISADVNTKQIERTEETYDPNSQVIRSEQRNKEKSIGSTGPIGVPGVLSNLPEGNQNPQVSNPTPPQTQKQDEVINYELSKVVSHVVEPVGTINRLTVAVLVDGTYETTKGPDGKEVKKFIPRTDQELAKFTDMVRNAVGFSEKRGDVITVVSTPFDPGIASDAGADMEKPSRIPPYLIPMLIKYGSVAIIALFAILFILRPVIKRLTEERVALESIQQSLPGGLAQREMALGAGATEEESLKNLKKAVRENPQQVALALKGWMKEK